MVGVCWNGYVVVYVSNCFKLTDFIVPLLETLI